VIRTIDADLAEYEVDEAATKQERTRIRAARQGWLKEDPEQVAIWYRAGEIDVMDVLRRYGVLLNWGTGELLPRSTEQFRETMRRRASAHWGVAG
jgi:N-methylhydantoinase B